MGNRLLCQNEETIRKYIRDQEKEDVLEDKLTKKEHCVCELSYNSYENNRIRNLTNMHPVIPTRGEIYNAIITEGVGKELCGNHLVIIVQNANSNMYSDKVTVIPIEGDGNYIKKSYQMRLKNSDLENGHIDKEPSRIIFSDILTIDKARLGRKIGKLTEEKINKINNALKKHLSL